MCWMWNSLCVCGVLFSENGQLIIADVNIDIYLTIAGYFLPYMVKISTRSYSYITFLEKKSFPFGSRHLSVFCLLKTKRLFIVFKIDSNYKLNRSGYFSVCKNDSRRQEDGAAHFFQYAFCHSMTSNNEICTFSVGFLFSCWNELRCGT